MDARTFVLALTEHGLSQGRIGELTGMAQNTVSRIVTETHADCWSRHYRALEALHYLVANVPGWAERVKGG